MTKEEIEELAFKDRKELANLNELDLLEIIEFLQNDRKQWINQFTQTHNESIDIQKENQELKKQLENCYCNRTDCSGRIKNSRKYDSLYQKYKSSSNNSCVTKEKNIVGKNLLEGTYFDGNGIPKMIGITKAEYLEYKKLQQENKQLKIQISAREEVCNRLESNWNKLKEYLNYKSERAVGEDEYVYDEIYNEMQELKKQVETYEIEGYEQNEELNKKSFDIRKYKTQQKEFIKYMNAIIEDLEAEDVDDEEMKGYLIQRINTFKEILQKYKTIIGVSDDKK